MTYINFLFSNFWVFAGHAILLFMFLTFLIDMFDTIMKSLTVWLRGYPRKSVADEIIHKAKLRMIKEKRDGDERGN